jgi:hypothetical protein
MEGNDPEIRSFAAFPSMHNPIITGWLEYSRSKSKAGLQHGQDRRDKGTA